LGSWAGGAHTTIKSSLAKTARIVSWAAVSTQITEAVHLMGSDAVEGFWEAECA
jgi:hypothetical protein